MAAPAFFDKGGVALNIIGMFLAVVPPILGTCAISLLLLRVQAAKVVWILRPPALIQPAFLLAATLLPATGFLSFFNPRIRDEQPATKRALPPLRHKDFSPAIQTSDRPSMRGLKHRESKQEGKGRAKKEATVKKMNSEEKGESLLSLYIKTENIIKLET